MKSSPRSRSRRPVSPIAHLSALLLLCFVASCSDTKAPPPSVFAPVLLPGEICDPENRPHLKLAFDPPTVVVAPGETRPVRLTVEPDACEPNVARLVSADPRIAESPIEAKFDLRHATFDFLVKGDAAGRTTITAAMDSKDVNGDPYTTTADLPVHVRDRTPPTCTGGGDVAQGTLAGGSTQLQGTGALAKSYLSVPPGAFARDDEFALPPFPATISCDGGDLTTGVPNAKLRTLGPAVSFVARAPLSMAKSLRREVEVSLPVNPAAFPSGARMRHLLVLYKGPRIKTPRPIPIANPRIEPDGGDGYILKFQTPWLGTFQAAVAENAGANTHKRHLTHRAVIGFSMGGGGAAIFGMRHHDQFDVIAPLGGPSDWTWLLWYVEQNALGGFCPAGKTCPKVAPNRYPGMDETFAHTMDYEHWFYETGSGNGGHFPRSEYVQIFEDLALSMGNPNGSSTDPNLLGFALGPKKNDPSFTLPDGTDCSFTIDPIGKEPDEQKQKDIEAKCKAFRCDPKNAYHADTNYFDDEYNPDGSLPVISFCDGNSVPIETAADRYVNTWAPGGDKPVNLGLAVDLNKNGVRDQGEPVIRSGHEPYDDCGPDKLCDAQEPGYDPETNPDPSQDDYDYQLNPTGTEGNHRFDEGERFLDYGLDGVPNTAGRHVAGDPGEGDGKFTESVGLANFYANDAHNIISRRVTDVPGGAFTDDAMKRLDILSDGGVRDLFNFAAVANHLTGQAFGRRGANGLPLRSAAFYNGFHFLPGEPQDRPNFFNPGDIRWADVVDYPSVRYGDLDASKELVTRDGDGQHVGTAAQLLNRLQTAFFYVGQRWPDADRLRTEDPKGDSSLPTASLVNELGVDCEIAGKCEKIFTGPRTHRTGPIAVSLPPGYALKANVDRNVRYPVLYVLHGYGQDPRDLSAVAIFTDNFMNVPERSYATRLPKFIIVYVDGRCRIDANGRPECIRGTFYMNSARPDGTKLDDWFEEVTEYVDQNYRTMPPSDVDVQD